MKKQITMNIESMKLNLLEWLAQADDKSILSKLKKFRDEIEITQYEKELKKPLTGKELISRAKRSEADFRKGRVKSLDEVVKSSKIW
ncbi:MAG: hypothetical protein ABI763_10470 [Bacteroidota bacterium]